MLVLAVDWAVHAFGTVLWGMWPDDLGNDGVALDPAKVTTVSARVGVVAEHIQSIGVNPVNPFDLFFVVMEKDYDVAWLEGTKPAHTKHYRPRWQYG